MCINGLNRMRIWLQKHLASHVVFSLNPLSVKAASLFHYSRFLALTVTFCALLDPSIYRSYLFVSLTHQILYPTICSDGKLYGIHRETP